MADSFDNKKHYFDLTPGLNGGESLSLTTTFHDNGDGEYYTNQELTLQSYGNAATFHLCGASLEPETLRRLASELEALYIKTGIIKGPEID